MVTNRGKVMGVKINETIQGELIDYTLKDGMIFGDKVKVAYSDITGTAYIEKGEDFISLTQDQMYELAKILQGLL